MSSGVEETCRSSLEVKQRQQVGVRAEKSCGGSYAVALDYVVVVDAAAAAVKAVMNPLSSVNLPRHHPPHRRHRHHHHSCL